MKTSILTVPVHKVAHGVHSSEQDWVAVEEPLEIRLGERSVAITMRTPGSDEELAAGFLFTEGILRTRDQLATIGPADRNLVTVELAGESQVDLERLDRHFYISSSCGVCGKASIDALESTGCPFLDRNRPLIDAEILLKLPVELRSRQAVFDRTGGLHAAALFDSQGRLLQVREDVGRHNAVDKLVGAAFLAGEIPLSDRILLVSGRVSFELVQKALMGGIAVLAAVGAPSSLAVEVALRYGMTLVGFVREQRFNVYSGEWRLK